MMDKISIPIRIAATWSSRMRGLLHSRVIDEAIVLVPCCSIHTFGMGYPIDIAFLDKERKVIETKEQVGPCRVVRCRRASAVIECASDRTSTWFEVGDHVSFRVEDMIEGKDIEHENLSDL